jgi:hypothetical protein
MPRIKALYLSDMQRIVRKRILDTIMEVILKIIPQKIKITYLHKMTWISKMTSGGDY